MKLLKSSKLTFYLFSAITLMIFGCSHERVEDNRGKESLLNQAPVETAHSEILEQNEGYLTVQFKGNTSLDVTIDSSWDNSNALGPNGYQNAPQNASFCKQLVVENTGNTRIDNPKLVTNGFHLGSFASIVESLDLDGDPAMAVKRFFNFWKDFRYHQTTQTSAHKNLFCSLNYFGSTFCEEDFHALSQIFAYLGLPARLVPLNGHVVGEYFYDDKWHIVDGDQNAVYLTLDNQTLASFEDTLFDPFILLRTHVFGKYQPYSLEKSWSNCSLYEHVSPKPGESKLRDLRRVLETDRIPWSLNPGERMTFFFNERPKQAIGGKVSPKKAGLGIVEFQFKTVPRSSGGRIRLVTPYPMRAIKNLRGEILKSISQGEPVFELSLNAIEEESLIVECQGTLASFPALRKGSNSLRLESNSSGSDVKVSFSYDTKPRTLPVVRVKDKPGQGGLYVFDFQNPYFQIEAGSALDKIWWQVSDSKNFDFVHPNWDLIQEKATGIQLSSIDTSFFISGKTYFFRVKGLQDGTWGNWSEPFEFNVNKPPQPVQLEFHNETETGLVLSWDVDQTIHPDSYLIFGSNRRDFFPDIYTKQEITEMRDHKMVSSQENKNLLAETDSQTFAINKRYRYYRVISRKSDVYSTPSKLVELPESLIPSGSKNVVLQTRWKTKSDPNSPQKYKDIYHAKLLNLTE